MARRFIDTDHLSPLLHMVGALLSAERALHKEDGDPVAVRYIYLGLWANATADALRKFCAEYPDLRPVIDIELPEKGTGNAQD